MMPEQSGVELAYSGEQLLGLTEDFRFRIFRATLLIAALLLPVAAALILLIGKESGTRLALLGVLGICSLVALRRARWCYGFLDRRQWAALVPASFGALLLIIGGARQNATFLVIGAIVIGLPAVIEFDATISVGGIIACGYLASIAVRHEGILLDGAAGDLAAVASFLAAIYASHRTVEIVMMGVADLNAGTIGARHADAVIAQEATGQIPEAELAKLSGFRLTRAELPVAYLAGDGLPQQKIADRLEKATRTVEDQLASIKSKLDVDTHPELTSKIRILLAGPAADQKQESNG